VDSVFSGTPAAPKLATHGQRRFRTVIREGTRKGANFAGHYAIVEWGCGTACAQIAVVDVNSGDVYEGPFGILPKGVLYLGSNPEDDYVGMFYRRDSSLLVVRGCVNEKDGGAFYYAWVGARFKLLRRDPIKGLLCAS
jgi:hypothetical protein